MGLFTVGRPKPEYEQTFNSATVYSSAPPELISEDEALKIPAVRASVELIADSISTLPIYLYQDATNNDITKIEDDDRVNKLNHDANKFDTAQTIKKKVVKDYLLHGKAFIYKKEGALYYLESKNMRQEGFTEDNIVPSRIEYEYIGLNASVRIDVENLIIIDSGSNGILSDGGTILQNASKQIEYSTSLLHNSAVPVGMVKAASRLTQTAIDRLKASFEKIYSGTKNAGRTMILEEGMDYKPLSLKPDELQLTEASKQTISEVARLFNIPESLINSDANKYASLEQNTVQFLQNTLLPIITQIESSFDKYLLDDFEKQLGYYFRFDTSEIIRTTEKEKIETVTKGLKEGLFSFNEARTKLDLPKDDKDFRLLSIGSVMKYDDGQMVFLNLGQDSSEKQEVEESNE
ncbi:phage portal protein [Robertmurraya massiliosenegalensis]|uniref:phage portal protein n=1 Tax=Robertmurraya massiliosenegalensis TaxID=1287657 RepID=UPI000314762D|nr:phage portal protein [Robertmurraya massiliosenegalensis]